MASQNPNIRTPLYPQVIQSDTDAFQSNPNTNYSSGTNLYPQIDMTDLVENLFPDNDEITQQSTPSAPLEAFEEIILRIPGAILHLIDDQYSVELAYGDLSIFKIQQGDSTVAIIVRVSDQIQWPLAKDQAAVKLDESHYFFSFKAPNDEEDEASDFLNYGLTIASKGQENLLKELDRILEHYSSFSVQEVEKKVDVMNGSSVKELSPMDLKSEKKKEKVEGECAAYWTTLAPNVEDYSGTAAKLITAGSGQLIKGILWCGDVTVERLKWGNEIAKRRSKPNTPTKVRPETLKKIRRVKRVSKMTEKVAGGILSGVIKVSGFFTSSVANSKVGKKFFSLLPGEIILASLDGFGKICDAVEVSGKNVMSTSSTVTTEFVTHKYGEEAGKATSEGLDAAGHAIGSAWAVFKIRKAFNPKSVMKPSSLAKAAAASTDVKKGKKK
ncbi:protein EARLY-RESPONSIVE TO DEHYDRATION 7, chloroplastic-like [Impatiens glandulifera]|uniref:protein EARLY-RESPONSIVE TO DEHYDRATION 7, chloroplastic-like n=1 Tax=Impatiens glandulifera TaxID=253017 RepID=UPI001FB116D6|nr:protein EARLY-RESPONSIVE TO DEHYDRATION 7, chloroplastic-like [Impatiens glandulifera]